MAHACLAEGPDTGTGGGGKNRWRAMSGGSDQPMAVREWRIGKGERI